MRGSKYYYKRLIIGPPAKRHLMEFCLRADDGPTLNAGLVAICFFQGIQIRIAKKPYMFCDFSRGEGRVRTPVPFWIRTCIPIGKGWGTE